MSEQVGRRKFLGAVSAGTVAAILPGLSGDTLQAQATNPSEPHSDAGLSPKALVFDTFGTVVDWRGSIIAEGTAWARARGITVDWARFADQWRNGYAPSLEKVRRGELP